MRMLVLGAGLQGSACAYDLLGSDDVEEVVLADLRTDALPPFLERYRDDPRLRLLTLDARDHDAVRRALEGKDACLNALPYYFNRDMTELAVRAGVHYCDLGGNTEIVFQQLELDGEARERGVSAVPDCGLAPGMVNILAAEGIRELDQANTVRLWVGGLPQHPEPPLNYQVVYSLEGVIDYYTTKSWVLREGRLQQVEALSEVETVEFPEPIGTLEAFHTAGGLSTLPWKYQGRVETMEYRTLRYPGHAQIMRAIRDLGLLDLTPVRTRTGVEVVPRDVFIACAEPRLRRPDGRDLVAARVEVQGVKAGQPRRITYELIDYYDEQTGISAMERTTGFSLSITGQLQVRGRVARPGVCTPDECIPAGEYVRELERRGIRIRRQMS
ncbi:MAG TPA: saccharopine dehydrogenase C-terminal domain-containing protein [Longimicrobiales bacterium]